MQLCIISICTFYTCYLQYKVQSKLEAWRSCVISLYRLASGIKTETEGKKEECGQNPVQFLESIAANLNNDRPIKLEAFHKLGTCLKHFKFKQENSVTSQKKQSSEDTFSKLMSIVQNVSGMSCEPNDNEQSSHNSNMSNKDQETVILSGEET